MLAVRQRSHFTANSKTRAAAMLTSKSVTELGKIFRFFHALTICPYEWNGETKSLSTTNSRWRLALWKSYLSFFIINTIYTTVVFIARILAGSFNSSTRLVLHCVFMASNISFVFGCLGCFFYVSEIEEFVNQVLRIDKKLTGKYSIIN